MCDIIVATPAATATGATIFGKNSDRDPNEAQALEISEQRPLDEPIDATFVSVDPDLLPTSHTNRVLLNRPWWTWGAEMGANEHGLVAGNVAVFTREPYRERGLLGMDLLRIALECTDTPSEAVDLVGSLLETVGQGGPNSYSRAFDYHNSFIFANSKTAWLLESAGDVWVATELDGVYSISNRLTMGSEWDRSSTVDPRERAADRGWFDRSVPFDFAAAFTDPGLVTRFSGASGRRGCTSGLTAEAGSIDRDDVIDRLSSHDHEPHDPQRGSMRDVCMHYGGTTRPSRTAASQVSVLDGSDPVHWLTIASTPCYAPFKPITVDGGLPDLGPAPTNRFDPSTYWWRREVLHRRLEVTRPTKRAAFRSASADCQQSIDHLDSPATADAIALENHLYDQWEGRLPTGPTALLWTRRWREINGRAGIPVETNSSVPATVRAWRYRMRERIRERPC